MYTCRRCCRTRVVILGRQRKCTRQHWLLTRLTQSLFITMVFFSRMLGERACSASVDFFDISWLCMRMSARYHGCMNETEYDLQV